LKILIFLLAVLFGVWLWRKNRLNALKEKKEKEAEQTAANSPQTANKQTSLQPSPMLACQHCGVHMPESDMLKGKAGSYCSAAHRQAAGDQAA
jgi:uncharacterized protein